MTAVPHVLAVRCHFCSHERPFHRVHVLASGQAICDHCIEWHLHAIEFLGGAVPRGCQECGITWDTLRDSTPGDEVKMYIAPKDGIYQLLCARCIRVYAPKRADLYRGTQFGNEVLKIG